jgi:hypothetical protein
MRFFTGFLIAIGLIVLLFVIILKHGNGPKLQTFNLDSYANSGAVSQLTITGPITADKTHQSVQVTVGATQTTFQILQGYQGRVQTSRTFENNQTSYSYFLQALTVAGFARGSKLQIPNKYGYCASGETYTFELLENSSAILNNWATSCGTGIGTFRGSTSQTVALFQAQVPDYQTLTSNLSF